MTKRAKIITAAVAGLALIAAVGALVYFLGPAKAERTRKNVVASAQYYLDKGDYARALDLLDKLLIDNASDPVARSLRDRAMQGKATADAAKASEAASAEAAAAASGQKALAQSLDKLGQKLKTGASSGGAGSANASSTKSAAAQSAAAAKAEAESQKKAEADAAAAQKKAESDADAARKKG